LAKSYPVLHWANENALFDTLAGIELLSKHLNNCRNFWERFGLLTNLIVQLLLSSYKLCGAMRCSRGSRLRTRINTRHIFCWEYCCQRRNV
jgi:hypothetical protein